MQPREMLHNATIDFYNQVSIITNGIVVAVPWYRRLFMDELQLKWLDNRRSISVGLYDAVLKLCEVAIENDYAIDSYSCYVADTTKQLIEKRMISFLCDSHLEVHHRVFMRSYERYQQVVANFKSTFNIPNPV